MIVFVPFLFFFVVFFPSIGSEFVMWVCVNLWCQCMINAAEVKMFLRCFSRV